MSDIKSWLNVLWHKHPNLSWIEFIYHLWNWLLLLDQRSDLSCSQYLKCTGRELKQFYSKWKFKLWRLSMSKIPFSFFIILLNEIQQLVKSEYPGPSNVWNRVRSLKPNIYPMRPVSRTCWGVSQSNVYAL